MICPECSNESKVINSRDNRRSTYRRRECLACGNRWSTFEVLHLRGMDPYPMCKEEGCYKQIDPCVGMDYCKPHYRAYRNKQAKKESYAQKRRLRKKKKTLWMRAGK